MQASAAALTLLTVCLWLTNGGATGDSLYFLLPRDTVVLRHDKLGDLLLFDHYLAPRQTLYGAARFYGHNIQEVYRLNPHLRDGYAEGSRMTVAIPRHALRTGFNRDSIAWFVPVHYRVSAGETLYGLSRRTLGHDSDSLLRHLNPDIGERGLSPGQLLTVGYLCITGIDPDEQVQVRDPYLIRNAALREQWEAGSPGRPLRHTNGKAAWTARGDPGRFMIMHRTAPIGSLVEIEEPRSRKIVYARVVARVPEQLYDARVVMVASPLLVKTFGVRDKFFYVRTRHY